MGQPSALNQKIVTWASGQVGKQVDAGECWDLANRALLKSGAKSSSDLGPMGPDDDYVWGTPVDLKDALPGDILQYRDHVTETTIRTDVSFADEHSYFEIRTSTVTAAHHTAIVFTNPGNGVLKVLEQNDGGNHEKVRTSTLHWKSAATRRTTEKKAMKRKDNAAKTELATVITTVDVGVTGTVTAYRPVAK